MLIDKTVFNISAFTTFFMRDIQKFGSEAYITSRKAQTRIQLIKYYFQSFRRNQILNRFTRIKIIYDMFNGNDG